MRPLRRLGRGGRLLLALAVGGAVFGIASAVQASIPSPDGVIHGCYGRPGTAYKGQLRVRDASIGEQCRFYENQLDWNQTGPSGATGPTGPTGPAGTSATALWAIVNDDGTLRKGSHVVSTTKVFGGEYGVIFDQDVSACAFEVSQRPIDAVFDSLQMLYQATAKGLGNSDRVEVRVRMEGDVIPPQQQNFSLAVFC